MNYSFITGVDIGHYSIKAVVIKPVKGTLTLSACRELVLRESIFSDNHLLNHQEIVNKLKQLRKALPAFSRSVAFSVPDNSVISKVLQIDNSLSAQEKEYAIIEAFSHQSPFDVEELYFDHYSLSDFTASNTHHSAQLYATKKTVVDNRTSSFRQAGFKPQLCDTQGHALTRLLQLLPPAEHYHWLLLDVGLTRSLLVRDFAQQPPWCKEIPIGIDDSVPQTGEPFVSQLVEHVQRQWQLLPTQQRDGVRGMWLTGGGANTPELAEQIATQLKLNVQRFNPFDMFEIQSTDIDVCDGGRYAGAIGLSLLGYDWRERDHANSN
ncbi:type IV pilus biogenesis protein PilM [Vibrio panuliri]|uniref:Pilus assembly protein PilM n=1 Tax=Vibrio panuliri TaxID=1381081 RepID=A0ABX3F5P6_9VIBR|nr:type IV pilus assembly protein PilM [Vibrio panuliri]KAB1459120.1 type IV pilus assembly protein PilM [Vibrio panuliri]OLQ84994.1 hypothetical protein BIY20_03255 [Vibrio panuliri]